MRYSSIATQQLLCIIYRMLQFRYIFNRCVISICFKLKIQRVLKLIFLRTIYLVLPDPFVHWTDKCNETTTVLRCFCSQRWIIALNRASKRPCSSGKTSSLLIKHTPKLVLRISETSFIFRRHSV
jgi:hypothetical protein